MLLDITDLTQVDSYCDTLRVKAYTSLHGQGGDLKLLHPGGHVLEVYPVDLRGLLLVAVLVVMLVKLLVTLHRWHELPRYAQPTEIVYRA